MVRESWSFGCSLSCDVVLRTRTMIAVLAQRERGILALPKGAGNPGPTKGSEVSWPFVGACADE